MGKAEQHLVHDPVCTDRARDLLDRGVRGPGRNERVTIERTKFVSLSTDVAGNASYSANISITLDNPTPTTAVLIPSGGAKVSGTSYLLDASASANVTYVTFELSSSTLRLQTIATAIPTYYGWIAQWNSTSIPDGTYSLQSMASYSENLIGGTSAPVTITVNN